MRLCIGTWEGESYSLTSNMLKGIAILIATFDDKLKDDMFKEKLGAYTAKEIIRNAKDRRPGSMGYAEAMLLAYNRKLKNPLNQANLYSANKLLHDNQLILSK